MWQAAPFAESRADRQTFVHSRLAPLRNMRGSALSLTLKQPHHADTSICSNMAGRLRDRLPANPHSLDVERLWPLLLGAVFPPTWRLQQHSQAVRARRRCSRSRSAQKNSVAAHFNATCFSIKCAVFGTKSAEGFCRASALTSIHPIRSVGALIVGWLHLRGVVEANIFDMPGLVSTRHALGGAFDLFF